MARDITTIRDLPDAERPREKLAAQGPEALANAELIAILLRTGSSKESAIALATRLLGDFDGLAGIAAASVEQLSKVPGIGIAKAAQVKAAVEIGKRLAAAVAGERPTIRSPRDAVDLLMESLRREKKEHLIALYLDARKRLVCQPKTIFTGSLDRSVAHPREVFQGAVAHSAHSVIVVHNHPSGSAEPSRDDLALTKRLSAAGAVVGVPLIDHIIIGDGCWVSLKERGDIPDTDAP
jgi:DNA repair protein RadC